MQSASHYREQARILLEWTRATADPGAAKRVEMRAREYLELAAAIEDASGDTGHPVSQLNLVTKAVDGARPARGPGPYDHAFPSLAPDKT